MANDRRIYPWIDLLLTCEHGGNGIPARYRTIFKNAKAALHSHRGWDPGALAIARQLGLQLSAPLVFSETSRLLIDLNRSPDSATLLSEFSRDLPPSELESIRRLHYSPYRTEVTSRLEKVVKRGRAAIHLSIHSFAPVLRGRRRPCQIGVLFDPSRPLEARVAAAFRTSLQHEFPRAKVRLNYPYQGVGDGLTTTLRKKLPGSRYAGIELELNQAWLKRQAAAGRTKAVSKRIASAIDAALTRL